MRLYDGRRFYLSGIQQSGAMGNPAIIPMWRRQALGLASPEAAGTQGQLGGLQGQGGAQTGGLAGGSAASTGGPSSGLNIGGFNISGHDIAQTVGSGIGGVLGSLAGPLGGIAGGIGGRLIGGGLYDYFNPAAPTSQAPAPAMQPSAEPSVAAYGGEPTGTGFGSGALSGLQAGALNSVGSITGNAADVMGPNIGGDITSGGPGSGAGIGGGTGVEPSGGLDSTSGGGYRRGGRTVAKHHHGALSRRLKGKRR